MEDVMAFATPQKEDRAPRPRQSAKGYPPASSVPEPTLGMPEGDVSVEFT